MSDKAIYVVTAEEDARHQRLATLAEQDRFAIGEQMRRVEAAAAEPSFRGAVRRALLASDVPLSELLSVSGITLHELDEFRCGERDLSFDAFERLAERLGFALVRTLVATDGG